MFLKSIIERLGVAYENAIPTMVILFQCSPNVIVDVAVCVVIPTETGEHCFVDKKRNSGSKAFIRTEFAPQRVSENAKCGLLIRCYNTVQVGVISFLLMVLRSSAQCHLYRMGLPCDRS